MIINGLKFTEYQIRQLTNGCGAKKLIIRPPYHLFFEASCHIHDINYWIGGTEEDRKKSDIGFYKYMKKDVKSLFKWYNIKRHYFLGWCLVYLLGVRLFGWRFFNSGVKKTQTDVDKIKPVKSVSHKLVDLTELKRLINEVNSK